MKSKSAAIDLAGAKPPRQWAKEKSNTGKRLLAGIVFMASLLCGQAFAISLGQGFPQVIRQSVIVNEKLQTAEQDVLLLAAKLKNASGGSQQKPLKSIGALTFETQYSIGFSLNLNAKSPQVRYFLQTDPVGYQDSMNLYQGMNMNPGNFVDPMGEWVQGVHKDITMNAARLAALSIQNIFEFISKRQAEFFSSGLKAGSVWPDMPEGPIGALQNAFDIIQIQPLIIGGQVYIMPNFGLVEESNPNTSSLTWQSHFGPLQYWHAMSYGNRPREETRRLIINDVSNWLKQARELLYGDAGKLSSAERYNAAGQMAGRALHVIEDSYTKSHTKRDKYTFAIIEFFDYSKQNKAEHEKMDVLNNETRLNYKKAEEIALKVLILLLQKDNKQFDAELAGMLETIFKLNN